MQYDCVIVGGGFAGLQAAIQLGRYRHKIAVVDAAEGRSAYCRNYDNLIGWPEGVSGMKLRAAGRLQAERLGVRFIAGTAVTARRRTECFVLELESGEEITGARLLLATGVKDRIPGFRELIPCLGISVYICPDCDGYEVADQQVAVIGSGTAGANMALTLRHWTSRIIYINHETADVPGELLAQLAGQDIPYYEQPVAKIEVEDESQFRGVMLKDGTAIRCSKSFLAFGGNEVRSGLAEQLGAGLTDNRHVITNPRTKLTTADYVWAAGDVTSHSEMVTIAMGDGSQAAIWIHKSLIGTFDGRNP
ncbi:NAD(P)/FAD-dependent oxidoreductase [Paenibacillus protaetiae]|uniref:NAD(P)/FAD-dependent oxidoreductase n=1 Tax=Paenibacillus protaetiae TaxID=2509456 RepID=A0A4P6EWC2_9BACL|nr:NAD(P)/FAD-dependent oxidoreductase [Paenibacillus protaetiae]QAY66483.1 NAD(P)/FAD-dependent oxidoreductase [Paenibacillus protaetiae]